MPKKGTWLIKFGRRLAGRAPAWRHGARAFSQHEATRRPGVEGRGPEVKRGGVRVLTPGVGLLFLRDRSLLQCRPLIGAVLPMCGLVESEKSPQSANTRDREST